MAANKFELDEQTIKDLAIYPGHTREKSILELFDSATTFGGKYKLSEIFANPLTNLTEIQERIDTLKYFQQLKVVFKIDKGSCDFIEHYLKQHDKPTSISIIGAIEKRIAYYFTRNSYYYTIKQGISYTLLLLKELQDFLAYDIDSQPDLLQRFRIQVEAIMQDVDFIYVQSLFNKKNLNAIEVAKTDFIFRYKYFDSIKILLDIVYFLDVFITVSALGKKLNFSFPIIDHTQNNYLKLEGLFHPLIENPIVNKIDFDSHKNMCFVTGTNMAGKSTLLKSVAISVFLSQLGFPVPASFMKTSGFKGLITTINISDNLFNGNSHFYAEVSRIKHVAQVMNEQHNIMVIFDELFRGTNVKDAYDASLSVIKAFAKLRTNFFIISTHIIEVAHELKKIENINFKYMETCFKNGIPIFSYQLLNGITEERLGMWIVENEGIVALIENAANQPN